MAEAIFTVSLLRRYAPRNDGSRHRERSVAP